jgi:hypothetical protein
MSPTESSYEGQDEDDEELPYSFYTDKRHSAWNNNVQSAENVENNSYYCQSSNSSFVKNQKMLNFTTDWRIREKIKTVR